MDGWVEWYCEEGWDIKHHVREGSDLTKIVWEISL